MVFGIICLIHIYIRNKNQNNDESFHVDTIILVIAVLLFLWIGYYAGWGRFVTQERDWYKHNAILSDLMNRKWPVYYNNGDEHSMLSYYIGQYIIPAFVGKLFKSFRTAEIAVYIWNEIGLILVYLNILKYLKTDNSFIHFFTILLVPFFSIPLWLSQIVVNHFIEDYYIESTTFMYLKDSICLQYSGNFILLKWVFPQAIPIWLTTLIWLAHKDKIEFYVPMLLPAMFFGTFGFLGLVMLAFSQSIDILIKEKNFTKWIKKIFSLENVSTLITLGTVFLAYFSGNMLSEKPKDVGFGLTPYTKDTIGIYFTFVIANVISYAVILFKEHKKEGLYYAVFLILTFLPLFRLGLFNDLVMRSSVPMLLIVMIYAIQSIQKLIDKNAAHKHSTNFEKICAYTLIVLLLLGLYTNFSDLTHTIRNENYKQLGDEIRLEKTLEVYANRNLEDGNIDMIYNYYAYDIENNIFYKLFAGRKIIY